MTLPRTTIERLKTGIYDSDKWQHLNTNKLGSFYESVAMHIEPHFVSPYIRQLEHQ